MTKKVAGGGARGVRVRLAGTQVGATEYTGIKSLDDFRSITEDADVIVAVDTSPADNHEIVFGCDLLTAIVDDGEGRFLKIAKIALDFRSEEVEHLLAAVGIVKGSCEWNGEKHCISALPRARRRRVVRRRAQARRRSH